MSVFIGILPLQAARNAIHLRLRPGYVHAGFEPPDHAQVVQTALRRHRIGSGRVVRDRHPQVSRLRFYWKLKPGRRHADDGEAAIVECDVSPDHLRVGVEAPPPQTVTEDHNGRAGVVLFRAEVSSQTGRNSEQREQLRRGDYAIQSLRGAAPREREAADTENRQSLKTPALRAPVHKVWIGNAAEAV